MWFKVDDKFRDHAKVRKLGKDKLAAVGLWTVCGTWAADNLTDGFVPEEIVRRDDAKLKLAARLVEVGLWQATDVDGEQGYTFHDWHDQNPSAEKVRAEREAAAERKRRWRERKTSRVTGRGTNGDAALTPTRPDPTPPKGGRGEGNSYRPVDDCDRCDHNGMFELSDGRLARCTHIRSVS